MLRPLLGLLLCAAPIVGCGPSADKSEDTGGAPSDSGDTAPDSGDTGEAVDSADSGDSGDSGDTADSGDSGDTADSGDTGDTGHTGDSGDSGDPDRDGDGSPDAADCAPDDPTVHPGAADTWCDGLDQDCDGSDYTTPTLTGADGVAVDVSADLAAGTESAPAILSVTDATLRVCGGEWYAGAWLSGEATVEARDGVVFRAGSSAAALQVAEGAEAVVTGLRVEDSYQGVRSSATGGGLTLEDVELVGNGAGVVWSGAASLTMRDTRVAESESYGVWMSGGSLVVEGGEITDSGGVDAGGLSLTSATATLTDTVFSGNTASVYAGGVTALASRVTLTRVTFDTNTGSSGGAVYGSASTIELADSTLSGNSAQAGGALWVESGSTLSVSDSTMEGNVSAGDGSAMVVLASMTTVERVVLEDNAAGNVATVISVGSDESYVDTEFLGNTAFYAPAHFAQSGSVTFTGGTFARNVAAVSASNIGFTTVFCGQDTTFDGVTVGSGVDTNSPAGFYDASTEYFELTTATTDCPNGECDIGSTEWCGT